MKRPYILVIIGVVLIIAAIALNYMLTQSTDDETAQDAASTGSTTSTTAPPAAMPTDNPAGDRQAAEETAPEIANPSFDVVRVGPDGNAVIAGRAAPNSTVRIREGDEVIGEATADQRGEWVVLPDQPLASGDRELSLEAESADGEVRRADDKVVVLIPDAPKKPENAEIVPSDGGEAASDATAEKTAEQPIIALKVPNEGGAATVLQGPAREEGALEDIASDEVAGGEAKARAKMPRLSVDVVDYDEQGRVAMSGKADADHSVRIYLDNQFVGTAPTDDEGNWALTIDQPIEPGTYTLRADQLDGDDAVTARVELPFERARPDQLIEPGSRYVVQPGNSLWRIARRTYGEGLKYWVIYHRNRNQIRDPDLIYPGQVFALPQEEEAVK